LTKAVDRASRIGFDYEEILAVADARFLSECHNEFEDSKHALLLVTFLEFKLELDP